MTNMPTNHVAELCKGSTTASGAVCLGSNPSSAAKAPVVNGRGFLIHNMDSDDEMFDGSGITLSVSEKSLLKFLGRHFPVFLKLCDEIARI